MNTTRRDFLRLAATAGILSQVDPFTSRLFAAPQSPTGSSLVVIFLRGAADSMNMLVPLGDPGYEAMRPTIASTIAEGVVPLDKTFGLHPAMKSLKPWFDAGKFAPIVCTGSPHQTRSHFDAQDWMEFAAPGDRTMRNGWINRYLEATKPKQDSASEFRALGMQELLPRSLRGSYPVLAVPTSLGRRKASKTLDRFEQFYGDSGEMMEGGASMSGQREEDSAGVVQSGRITIQTLRRFGEIVEVAEKKKKKAIRENQTVSGPIYPNSRFANRLQKIALVLRANEGLEVAGIDYGGWDDHTQEGGVEGRMADRMTDLSRSLAAFCQDLGPQLETTSILVMSEFGRTCHENGNSGTDHGHGGSMLLLGGGVKGGKVHGDWRGLGAADLYQGRDLAVTTDFRDVMKEVLENGLGFEPPKEFFPQYQASGVRGLY